MVLGMLYSLLGFQQTHSFHEQLQSYDKEIRYYQTRQRKFNAKVHSVPSKISQMIMLLGVVVCIPIYMYIPPPNLYYVMMGVMVLFLAVTHFIKKVVMIYYSSTLSSYNYDIEQLLLKQKEILEDLKQKNDYYATHDLIQKYERAINVLQKHIQHKRKRLQNTNQKRLSKKKVSHQIKDVLLEDEDDMEVTEVLLANYPYFSYEVFKKYTNTPAVSLGFQEPIPHTAIEESSPKEMNTICVQTESSLAQESHVQQEETKKLLKESMTKLFTLVASLSNQQRKLQQMHAIRSMPEGLSNENEYSIPTRRSPRLSITSADSSNNLQKKSHSFTLRKQIEDSTVQERISDSIGEVTSTPQRKRSNSFHGGTPTKESSSTNGANHDVFSRVNSQQQANTEESSTDPNIIALQQQLEQEIARLKQKDLALREREAKIVQYEKQLNSLSVAKNQQPIGADALYSSSLTSRYRVYVENNKTGFVENKKETTKPNWFDRLLDRIVGQSPETCFALICSQCCSHNGLLMIEDAENHAGYRCWNCGYLNIRQTSSDNVNDNASTTTSVVTEVDDDERDENDEKQDENMERKEESTSAEENNNNEADNEEQVEHD
ncbi:hypothetical protein C9374_002202 [Naegleria lovaniensis]|uniref:Endoplasmic reticulum junction formation protein lunapark n=1 Tax=Naegleria lovaniensis TaxID=51637 RepID=A0AA88GUY6_NAELO|nr:uncharacterized protein C9374_002202 [Naegleria lovaniensis]KAG2386458.1 hypothetical protein C9374_002202 [Naegleria lovaniensis]